MRLLISPSSKKELFLILKKKYNCNSINELSKEIKISVKTLQTWFYDTKRTIPEFFINSNDLDRLKIIDKRPDNWGNIKGGVNSYKINIKKYGIQTIKKRQSLGGINAGKIKAKMQEKFNLNITDPLFLEFYGILLGDGWIGRYKSKDKTSWTIGITCNLSLDSEFIDYCRRNVKNLFDRGGYIWRRPSNNSVTLIFRHKMLVKNLNEKLNFPIGKKENLKINKEIYLLGYNKVKHIIRGIFDTDGSFYLEKMRSGNYTPCISIHMKSPILMKQLGDMLREQGFKLSYSNNYCQIKIKTKKHLLKWIEEIGSSNPKHFNKINNFFNMN